MTDVYCQLLFTTKALRRRGCGAAASLQALHAQSEGGWRAKGKAGTTSARIRVTRSGIGREFAKRGLRPAEVFASMQAIVATDVRMDVPVQHRSGVRVDDLLAQLRRIGGVAIVAVDYSVVQDAGRGVTSFQGMHWVTVLGEDGAEVIVADPLRRQTTRWPTSLLRHAMERFGKRPWLGGRGEAIVVWPWRTWRQGYASKSAEAKAASNEAAALRKALAACEASK
ncbi:MAG: hypothetical protein U0667_17220 [Chloroflexota bacterium]